MEDKRKAALSLLFMTVIVSGCINGSNGTQAEGEQSITVTELSVQPSQVYEDSSTRATLEAVNTGNLAAEIQLGEEGSEVLKDHCQDIFELEEFSSTLSRTIEPLEGENSYKVEHGDSMRLSWTLQQTGHVPLYTLDCDMRFELPFDYSVQAFRQIEIKQDRDVEGSPNLESTSSTGPMKLEIGTVPGALGDSSTYTVEDDGNITVHMQLINQQPEQGYRKGVIGVDRDSLEIDLSEELKQMIDSSDNGVEINQVEKDLCSVPEDLTLYEGRSATITCDIPVPDESELDEPAIITEINAGLNYTYSKNAGTQSVTVERRE